MECTILYIYISLLMKNIPIRNACVQWMVGYPDGWLDTPDPHLQKVTEFDNIHNRLMVRKKMKER